MEETSIAAPGERAFLLVAREKAAFHMTVPGRVDFLLLAQGKADFRMTDPGKVVFQRTGRAKVGSPKIARGNEAQVRSGLLTENRARDLAVSVMATNLFSATGKVRGSSAKII